MIRFRDRGARGHQRGSWLDSHHTFSFGAYSDPKHMGFRSLRVINEDRIVPGAGFPEHAHADMEIVTVVLEGTLEHRDSLGTGALIRAGDVQRMSAGTGVSHSEVNPSPEDRVHLLQIWIVPDRFGLEPGYEQRSFPPDQHRNEPWLAASPDGRAGSLTVRQDAFLYLLRLDEGRRVEHALAPGRGAWVQVARGIVGLNGTEMREGDGAAVEDEEELSIEAETDAELLVFDLA